MEDLKRIRSGFVEKVGLPALKGLLDDLWQHKVLSTDDKDTVMEDQTIRTDRARCLIDMVMAKGERASLAMIDSMLERDRELYLTLGLILPPSPTDRVEPEHELSFSVPLVKGSHDNIESTVDFTASHAKRPASLLSRVVSIISSIFPVKYHGVVLVYKKLTRKSRKDHIFRVVLSLNNDSQIKAVEEMVRENGEKWIRVYIPANCMLEEKVYHLKSEPKGQIEPENLGFTTAIWESTSFFVVRFSALERPPFRLSLMDSDCDKPLWSAKIREEYWNAEIGSPLKMNQVANTSPGGGQSQGRKSSQSDSITETRSAGPDLSDKQLLEVVKTLGQEWEQVAIHLEMDDIKADGQTDVAMQKLKMLAQWRRRRPPGEATAEDLLRALEDMKDLPVQTLELLKGELLRIRLEFVKRVPTSVIKGLLDDLWQQKVFSTEEKDYVMVTKSRADQARHLIDMVIRKGERASWMMIDSMKKRDKHLCYSLSLISSLAGVGHRDDKTLVKPKEPTFFSRARDNKTRSAGRNLSHKQLMKVAEMLGQEWEQAAIHLELSITELDWIQADRQTDVAMQKYKMLERWKRQRPPGEATAQDLLRGLEDLEDLPFEARLLLTDYWTGEELPNLLERFLNQFQRSNENESHMHAVSSSENNPPESAPQLPQATEEDEEDTAYPMKAQPKGYCLIVNNFDFSRSGRNLDQRMGTDIDEKSLRLVFSWLGFQVEVLRDATRDQMLSTMRDLASRDHSGMDCVACIVLSHGLEGGVYGVKGKVVRLKELTDVLNGVRCASLRGTPKLFFIQACQGNKREQVVPVLANRPARPEVRDQTDTQTDGPSSTGDHTQTDGPSSTGDLCSDTVEASEWVPTTADFLTAMATTPSYTSMRDVGQGSWFIQSLCQQLVKLVPGGKDLASILTTVHNVVSKKYNRNDGRRQMSQHQTTLRTRLVFPVPEGPPPRLPTSP